MASRIMYRALSSPLWKCSLTNRSTFLIPYQPQCAQKYTCGILSIRQGFHTTNFLEDVSEVKMPSLSPTMTEGTIVKWAKNEGDTVSAGDVLCEIQTDKAIMALEVEEDGILAKILMPENSADVKVGTIIALVVGEGEDWKNVEAPSGSSSSPVATPTPTPPTPTPSQPKQIPKQTTSQPVTSSVEGRASPLARLLAQERGINLSAIGQGTGFAGSITSKDLDSAKGKVGTGVSQAASAFPSGASFADIPVSNMRAIIAKRLLQSKQTIPHYYLTSEIEMDRVLLLRREFNKALEKDKVKLSLNDFVIKAAAMACLKVPEANSSWQDTVIRQYNTVDISVAVSTDKGLITPIVFGAEKKGLIEISANVKELAAKAREGKLQPHEFQGGTFSISNLGMYGIHHFSAVINPPQACILALGGTTQKVIPADNEKGFEGITVMYATLSCDHRVVDGAVGAQWLSHFKSYLSNPAAMIM